MTDLWVLPRELTLEGEPYAIRWDYRTALAVMALLNGEDQPAHLRWFRALKRFYIRPVPDRLCGRAMTAMAEFLTQGQEGTPGVPLFDWQLDAPEIISDINRVAGFEVRKATVHWWTFLGWFHAIGEGRLSELVTLRGKLARGEKLTAAEEAFYRENRDRVRLRRPSDEEAALKERLK